MLLKFCFLLLLFSLVFADENDWSNNHKLRKKLLKNYDPKAFPQKYHNGTTTIYLGLFPRSIDIEDSKEMLITESWIATFWFDPRLAWDPKDFGGLKQAHFGEEELWQPDLQVYNNAEIVEVDHYGNVPVIVYWFGGVHWVPPAVTKTICPVDLKFWPFDEQKCYIEMGSWTTHGWQIDLQHWHNSTEIHMGAFMNTSSQWKVKSGKQGKNVYAYEAFEEPYVSLDFTFVLQRNSPAFATVLVLPAVVLPILLAIQFVLPVNHSKRMLVGFTCAVLFLLELQFAKYTIPKVGSVVPLIVKYYGLAFVMVIVSVTLSAILARISHPQYPLLAFAPPEIVKRILTGPVSTILCIQDNASKVGLSNKMSEDGEILASDPNSSNYGHEWLLIAKAIDRVAMVVFFAIFVISMIAFLSQLT